MGHRLHWLWHICTAAIPLSLLPQRYSLACLSLLEQSPYLGSNKGSWDFRQLQLLAKVIGKCHPQWIASVFSSRAASWVHCSGFPCFSVIMSSSLLNRYLSCPNFGFLPPKMARETFASSQFYQTKHNRLGLIFFFFGNEVRFTFVCPNLFHLSALVIPHFLGTHHFNHLGHLTFNLSFFLETLVSGL